MSTPVGRSRLPENEEAIFPESRNLEHYFHAALHLVWMVLEGELSICLVGPTTPSLAHVRKALQLTYSRPFLFSPEMHGV